MKKLLMGSLVAASSASVFAEGTGPDFTAVITDLTSVKTALASFATSALPIFGSIAAAFLIFYVGKLGYRMVKGWMNAGK